MSEFPHAGGEGDADDVFARMTAEMDQAIAGLGDAAKILAALRDHLEEAGFSRDEAIRLTDTFWAAQLTNVFGGEE